jgi:hypothetical protein
MYRFLQEICTEYLNRINEMITIQQAFKDLQDNLKSNCCDNFNLSAIPNNASYIKLYHKRSDACEQNNRFKWYDIAKIHKCNDASARPSGIVCYKCPNNEKCIVSFRIDKKNTRFAVIGKIELK